MLLTGNHHNGFVEIDAVGHIIVVIRLIYIRICQKIYIYIYIYIYLSGHNSSTANITRHATKCMSWDKSSVITEGENTLFSWFSWLSWYLLLNTIYIVYKPYMYYIYMVYTYRSIYIYSCIYIYVCMTSI